MFMLAHFTISVEKKLKLVQGQDQFILKKWTKSWNNRFPNYLSIPKILLSCKKNDYNNHKIREIECGSKGCFENETWCPQTATSTSKTNKTLKI